MKNAKTMGRRFAILVIAAVSLIPALYNLIFLSSMWDPYGNVANLPVAVVNQDRTATVSGKSLALGNQIVASLKKQKGLDYHFVSARQATSGLANGDYYMVVTLPDSLSKDAGTLLGDNPTTPTVRYSISEGHNFTASKMVTSAANALKSSVAEQVTQIYVRTLLTQFSNTGKAFTTANDATVELHDGTVQIAKGTDKLSTNLLKLSKGAVEFSNGADTLNVGVSTYTQAVSKVNAGVGKLQSGSTALSNGAGQLTAKGSELVSGLSTLSSSSKSGAQKLESANASLTAGMQTLSSSLTLSDAQTKQMQQLTTGLPKLNAAIQQLNAAIQKIDMGSQIAPAVTASQTVQNLASTMQSQLNALIAAQETAAASNLNGTEAYKQLSSAQQQEILSAVNAGIESGDGKTVSVTTLSQEMNGLVSGSTQLHDELQKASDTATQSMATLQSGSQQIATQSAQALPGSAQAITSLSNGLAQAKQGVDGKLIPGSQQLGAGIQTYGSAVSNGASTLAKGSKTYVNGVGTLGSGISTLGSGISTLGQGTVTLSAQGSKLVTGTQQLATASNTITQGSQQLATGEGTVSKALTKVTSGLSSMSGKFKGASDAIGAINTSDKAAKAVSAPVNLKQKETAAVPNNGTAMAPYMMSVALFVGALAFNMMFEAGVPRYRPRSGFHWWMQKMPTFLGVSIAQATFVFAAVMLLGLNPLHPGSVLLLLIFEALTYMSLITFFNVLFGKVGAFLMLLFLMLQLAGSGGTYPIVLSNGFYKAINPWLPMTRAIDGLRQAISIGGGIGSQLSLFIVLSVITNILILIIFAIRRRKILVDPSSSRIPGSDGAAGTTKRSVTQAVQA
ncbi:MAG: YhgE/Pip domain-containing protein [Bifidobacterium sp.]|uniref:YhgE/Pip family protein n=1 Tax=Bifidobacterium sp. TaxID=41200 RepID=UPI0039ED7203